MPTQRKKSQEIQDFIIDNVEQHQKDITMLAAEKFGISRQAILKHISKLEKDGILIVEGKTRNRKYSLAILENLFWEYPLENLEEDKIWRTDIRPHLLDLPKNVLDIFEYGTTEMINNAIDHSEGDTVTLILKRTATFVSLFIEDNGIGIFNNLQNKLNLDDPRHAVLELSKGKLTTDPKRHTGEGIFFTSRMFDNYGIASGNLHLGHIAKKDSFEGTDWLLEDKDNLDGTIVMLKIHNNSSRTTKSVFDFYTTSDSYGFDKTIVPVFLATYGEENLISRSQA